MNATGSVDIQQVLARIIAARPYSHRQDVERGVAAVITLAEDMRFFEATLGAVLTQSVLPEFIVVADCAGRVGLPVQSQFEVIPTPAGPASQVPETKTVSVRLVGVEDAASFGDAVSKALDAVHLDNGLRCVWMLHDDSRPADERCLEHLLETWRNAPTAALLGAKQLDWQAENLHDVGFYAGRHRLESLVVDGEPDQEQYDGRQDVFAVSLAGALVPMRTLHALDGVNPWFGTYGEAADFSRRVCLGGARVVVVPAARIAHRRARFEGVRTRDGEPVDERYPQDPAMSVLRAEQRYRYTDVHRAWWPLLWLWSLIQVLGLAVRHFFAKRPYAAWCVLRLPWYALVDMPAAFKARSTVRRQSSTTLKKLPTLVADRHQLAQWRQRRDALESQQHTVLLNPLAKAHLRRRALARFGAAGAMALAACAVVVVLYWDVLRSALSGGSLLSPRLIPTQASFLQLVQSATTPWVFGVSTGVPAPPAPWLLVWLLTSLLTLGHTAAALSLLFFASAPVCALSFWALAGIFTRSDAVRVVSGLLWFAAALALGFYGSADLAMLTVMMFLPAAFAFVFRAVGVYRTEDPVQPRSSVQAAACSALCFIPVVAAEPQLLLALVLAFLVFLMLVPRHRAMLLLIPLPAAFMVAPTLLNAVRYARQGFWRQLFGDITMPSVALNGRPRAMSFMDMAASAFGVPLHGVSVTGEATGGWEYWLGIGAIIVLAVLVALAVIALFLPFALRVSRMMWVLAVFGIALGLVSTRIVIAADADGPVAGSVTPGFVLALFAVLCCSCQVAGGAVKRYELLSSPASPALPLSSSASSALPASVSSASPTSSSTPSSERQRIAGGASAAALPIRAGRALLVTLLALGSALWLALGITSSNAHQVSVSNAGLPAVAVDYLSNGAGHRILALRVDSAAGVSYGVLRTGRGDLLDSSAAQRAQVVSGVSNADDATLSEASARLLTDMDNDAVASIVRLGFGGIYVATGGSTVQSRLSEALITHITASDGVQSVVSNASGTYYRLTALGPQAPGIDMTRQQAIEGSVWRRAWLWSAGLLLVLYGLVAMPRPGRRFREES
ncbi:MAG: glycosyltransferase family 2 protein [Bifidobacterium tibiigranuli]|jgi:hypothetical protein|uniref:glycosyltransferase family 2 protein n=1 Tax=Bifidobacterium tibiigranuli TaxID=2172043 RepID=UPI0026EA0EC9|nr:glycosyltransferase family 2 protein [Bifidobacterium tibiigranuli]MCI1673786.1 glycosyltransferase family 2 protein [Bifidobacterium tibiigranuli]MCI1712035.1 glycosyltransferase family 2 protein [Bifidobacterium tibiigranuli]MCI1835013.1 glycosyltransferase family 2 protein [Bifidobacterium tibiigranuli]